MPSISDITIKVYGDDHKFSGKYAAFAETDKAKNVLRSLGNEDGIIAGDKTNVPKVEAFCERNQLHYQLIIG